MICQYVPIILIYIIKYRKTRMISDRSLDDLHHQVLEHKKICRSGALEAVYEPQQKILPHHWCCLQLVQYFVHLWFCPTHAVQIGIVNSMRLGHASIPVMGQNTAKTQPSGVHWLHECRICAYHVFRRAPFPTCSSNLSLASPLAHVLGSLRASPRFVIWSCTHVLNAHAHNHMHRMHDRHTWSRKAQRHHSMHLQIYCTFMK